MTTLISFIIFSLILTYVYRKLHKSWVRFFGSNSKNTKKNKNKGNHKGSKSNQNVSNGIIKSYILPRLISANERRSASYEQVIPTALEPNQLPPLPRFPVSSMKASSVRKSNRRLSPWGGTIGDDL